MKKNFQTECEKRFWIPRAAFDGLFLPREIGKMPHLTHVRTYKITQVSLTNGLIGKSKSKTAIKTRLRAQTLIRPYTDETVYTYTTKFELTPENVIETNAVINKAEFDVIQSLYKGRKTVEKTRIVARDSAKFLIYTLDLYEGGDKVKVEIEFDSPTALEEYETPEWLNSIAVIEKKDEKEIAEQGEKQ